jgi:hypothetical protein
MAMAHDVGVGGCFIYSLWFFTKVFVFLMFMFSFHPGGVVNLKKCFF